MIPPRKFARVHKVLRIPRNVSCIKIRVNKTRHRESSSEPSESICTRISGFSLRTRKKKKENILHIDRFTTDLFAGRKFRGKLCGRHFGLGRGGSSLFRSSSFLEESLSCCVISSGSGLPSSLGSTLVRDLLRVFLPPRLLLRLLLCLLLRRPLRDLPRRPRRDFILLSFRLRALAASRARLRLALILLQYLLHFFRPSGQGSTTPSPTSSSTGICPR